MTKCFEVLEDGALIEVRIDQKDMKSSSIYFIVDYDKNLIFLWKGKKVGIRKMFAGARAATKMRTEIGLEFEVRPIDEGDEPYDFSNLFSQNYFGDFGSDI